MTTFLTPEEKAELRNLATKCKEGRWFKDDSPPPPESDAGVEAEADAAARLITKTHPLIVLALLDEIAANDAEIEALRAERDEWERKAVNLCNQNGAILIENHDLRADFDEYADHGLDDNGRPCPVGVMFPAKTCTCGLDEARRRWAGRKAT